MNFDRKVPSDIKNKLEELFYDAIITGGGGTMLLKDAIVSVSWDDDGYIILNLVDDIWTMATICTLIQKFPSMREHLPYDYVKRIAISVDSIIATSNSQLEIVLNSAMLPIHERRKILVVPENEKPRALKGIAYYTVSKSLELFKFPPNHPIANTAYAMLDIYPDHYIPINRFHDYYKESKHAAFIELCAALGAKEICIESAEINNQSLDIKGDINTLLSKLGLGLNIHENHETGQKVVFNFSESNKGIKDYDSPWLYTEPSWKSLNKLRRENRLLQLGAEFNCLDEMGIDVKLAGNFKLLGFNIGGSFSEMTKIKLSYRVIFWE